ncbi:hypothetical protein V8E54_009552 [Elaphomyces granulatus]
MGQEISVVIDAVDAIDHQEEKKKQAQDALNALVTVAKDKAIIHYQTVISNARDAKLLPIHHVVTTMQQTYCGISKNPAGLKQSIGNAVKNFVKGEIVDGLAAIASEALDTLMGSVISNSSEYSNYTITVGKLGGIGRIDFYMYYYKYTSQALITVAEDCLVTSLVISSVDISDLDENDIRVIVQNNYSGQLAGETDDQSNERQQNIVKLITAAISSNKK